MAAAVQAQFPSTIDLWKSGSPEVLGTEPVLASGAYPYTLPSSEVRSEVLMLPSPQLSDVDRPQLENDVKRSFSAAKNRGGSSTAKLSQIKTPMSTPGAHGQEAQDAAALALSAEKRRNKLGYHRTSVACGHCRRRKIRCIPAPADPQNRCSNCIRLKKECNFYPVDQQPQPDSKRKGSKSTSKASESSSPSTTSGQLPITQPSNAYTPLTMPPIQDVGGSQMSQRSESFSPETKAATSARGYEYSTGPTSWSTSDVSPSTKSQAEMPQSYWRPHDSSYPAYPPNLHMPQPEGWTAAHPEASPRDDLGWSVPQRSISYSTIEGGQNHPQYPYPPSHHGLPDNYTTRPPVLASGVYPPPGAPVSSGMPNQPYSAGSLPPMNYGNWPSRGYGQEQYGGSWAPAPEGQASGYPYAEPASGGYYPPPPPHPGR